MPLIPLAIQPGMFKNGTDYLAKGRWGDGDMVRWTEGSARPIGGWQRVVDGESQIALRQKRERATELEPVKSAKIAMLLGVWGFFAPVFTSR